MKLPTLLDMLKAGVHFGHVSSKRHPKMKPFIFGVRSGVNIINLEITSVKLEEAMKYAEDLTAQGGTLLFVGTKKQAQAIIKESAEKCGMPYVDERWLGGLLTNFSEIHKTIKRYNALKNDLATGKYKDLTKKARLEIEREIKRLSSKVNGIKDLTKLPDALFIVDIKKDKTAVTEAVKLGLPIIAVVDSNVNPEPVTYPIPGNDDAVKAIILLTNLLADAVMSGRDKRLKDAPAVEAAAPSKKDDLATTTVKKEKDSSEDGGAKKETKKDKSIKIVKKEE